MILVESDFKMDFTQKKKKKSSCKEYNSRALITTRILVSFEFFIPTRVEKKPNTGP
jgi:hypothetical protein